MQIGSHMVAGPQHEVDFFLDGLRRLSIEADLILALEIPAAPLDHCEIRIRGPVIVSIFAGVVLDCVLRLGPIEGLCHARTAVGLPDTRMTARADPGIRAWSLRVGNGTSPPKASGDDSAQGGYGEPRVPSHESILSL